MFTGKKKAACAAMLSLAMVAPLAAFAENETRVITCGTLNLRAEESASSAILGKYGWGTEVLVKGVNGDWASVDVGGQSGYMYVKYLGSEGTTHSTAYVKTNSRGLNLRAEPNGNILGSYPRGTKVTVLSNNGNWSKVSVDGKTGYHADPVALHQERERRFFHREARNRHRRGQQSARHAGAVPAAAKPV